MLLVVCFYSTSFLRSTSTSHPLIAQDPTFADLWELLRYTLVACNTWFRGLYQHGLFVPAESGRLLLPYGWALAVARLDWVLVRMFAAKT